MQQFIKFYFIALILPLQACGLIDSHSHIEGGNSFMPLSVGNRWEYNAFVGNSPGDSVNYISKITSVKLINGSIFYELENSHITGGDTLKRVDFLQLRNDTLYTFNLYDSLKAIKAVFNLSEGETITFPWGVASELTAALTVWESADDIMIFYFDVLEIADEETFESYQKGIGLTSRVSQVWGTGMTLLTYQLN